MSSTFLSMAGRQLRLDSVLWSAIAFGESESRLCNSKRTLEFAFFVALWPTQAAGVDLPRASILRLFELPTFWIYLTLALRGSACSTRGMSMLADGVLACIARRLLQRLSDKMPTRLVATCRIAFAVAWGSYVARLIEESWREKDKQLLSPRRGSLQTGSSVSLPELSNAGESPGIDAADAKKIVSDTQQILETDKIISSPAMPSDRISTPTCTPRRSVGNAQRALDFASPEASPRSSGACTSGLREADADIAVTTVATSPYASQGSVADHDEACMETNDDLATNALCLEALQLLMSYADAGDFRVQKEFPQFGIEVAKKDMRNSSLPVIRGQLTIDSAILPGDPKAVWQILAECVSVCISHSCRILYDETYSSAQILKETQSFCTQWVGQRGNASGSAYDYITACKVETSDSRVTVAHTSLPDELIPGGNVSKPGFQRNWLKVSGFDFRQIRSTEGGILLRVSYVLHTEAPSLPSATLASVLGPESTMLMTPVVVLTRFMDILISSMRPEKILMSVDGSSTLLRLEASSSKPLLVPTFVHHAFSKRLHRKSSKSSSTRERKPEVRAFVQTRDMSSNPEVESIANEALCRCRELLDSSAGWEVKDTAMAKYGIITSTCNVPGSRWPLIKAEMRLELPSRFNGSLQAAVAECTMMYMSHSVTRLTDTNYDRTALISQGTGCEVEARILMPSVLGKENLYYVLARGFEVSAHEGAEALIAGTSLPQELANKVMPVMPPELVGAQGSEFREGHLGLPAQFRRGHLGLFGFKFRGVHQQEGEGVFKPILHCTYLLNPVFPANQNIPDFLVRNELLLLPVARLFNFREILLADMMPEVIEHAGGCFGMQQPRISGDALRVQVAGRMRQLDPWCYSTLQELIADGEAERNGNELVVAEREGSATSSVKGSALEGESTENDLQRASKIAGERRPLEEQRCSEQVTTVAAATADAGNLDEEQLELERHSCQDQHMLEQQGCEVDGQRHSEELKALSRQQDALREQKAYEAAKVQKFLNDNGFNGVNSKKTSLMTYKYPLHVAVDKNDAEITRCLLQCRADPTLPNSLKRNALQLAESSNKRGSHDRILAELRANTT